MNQLCHLPKPPTPIKIMSDNQTTSQPQVGSDAMVLAWWQADMRDTLKLFPEVEWDRWAGGKEASSAFGWIARADGQRDFLVIRFVRGEVDSYTTSSAKHTASIADRLDFTHSDCRWIDELLGQNDQ